MSKSGIDSESRRETEAVAEKITIELNPREQRLYDRLRRGVVKKRTGEGSGVRDLLLLLPDLTVLLMRLLWVWQGCIKSIRRRTT